MMTQVVTGEYRLDGGKDIPFPQAYFDPSTRTIVIGEYEYPLERVVYWRRAKMAMSKVPEPPVRPDYTIGHSVSRPKASSK